MRMVAAESRLSPTIGSRSKSLGSRALDRSPFSQAQCDALFAAVLIDDRIDAETALPEAIHLDYTQEQLIDAFRLCRQVWKEGTDRRTLLRLVRRIDKGQAFAPEEQLVFKHVRAKFKHLRFAYANFDARHRYPPAFHLITRVMGHLQDGIKNGRPAVVRGYALLLRLMLLRPYYAFVVREANGFHPADPVDFRAHIVDQIDHLRRVLAKEGVTSKEFHETRKTVSRLVALYDSLRTLCPSPYHHGVSRYLSAINGLMGRLHDELISKKYGDYERYHGDAFVLPEDIGRRLRTLVSRFSTT